MSVCIRQNTSVRAILRVNMAVHRELPCPGVNYHVPAGITVSQHIHWIIIINISVVAGSALSQADIEPNWSQFLAPAPISLALNLELLKGALSQRSRLSIPSPIHSPASLWLIGAFGGCGKE